MARVINNRPVVMDENGVTYIVRGYEPWMQGRVIPENYVIRPRNHKWCGQFGGEYFRLSDRGVLCDVRHMGHATTAMAVGQSE